MIATDVFMGKKLPHSNESARKWYAVIVAGGTGNRFGGPIPKQFLKIDDKPVLRCSVDTFFACPGLIKMVVVTHGDWIDKTQKILVSSQNKHQITIIQGGPSRQDSSRLGLCALPDDDDTPVLIHDAARPWVSKQLIQRILNVVEAGNCAIPAIKAVDSIITMNNGVVMDYPDRSSIGFVQTPQGFPLKIIRDLHLERIDQDEFSATDDGSMAMRAGFPVLVVPGEPINRKITVSQDLGLS
ncbi:2-C-methyl-D-erythritol 4-phosphate cytidylyltransferase [bacterium]|nr:2-C-methyl-D-erythritol 4-phosphate cytidylyltransferase [bacterium]